MPGIVLEVIFTLRCTLLYWELSSLWDALYCIRSYLHFKMHCIVFGSCLLFEMLVPVLKVTFSQKTRYSLKRHTIYVCLCCYIYIRIYYVCLCRTTTLTSALRSMTAAGSLTTTQTAASISWVAVWETIGTNRILSRLRLDMRTKYLL